MTTLYGSKWPLLLFFNAVENDVNVVETQTVHFAWLLNRRFVLRDKQSRPRFLALANFTYCLPPKLPRNIAFIPSILKRVQRWRYRD